MASSPLQACEERRALRVGRGMSLSRPRMARPLLGQLGTQQEAVVKQASCEVTVPADHIWAECVLGRRAAVQESSGNVGQG